VQSVPVDELQKILLSEGAVFEQGIEIQMKALAQIRERFILSRIKPAKTPWLRPTLN
jgi:hypothetical protein